MSATILQSAPLSAASTRVSKSQWAGRILTGIAATLMAFDVTMKLAGVKQAVEGTMQLGFDPGIILPLGLIQLTALLLYIIPRSAPLGATLLTGYLGGAVAIHVRLGDPMFTHILAPVYFAAILWGGLYLRDARLRAFLAGAR